MGGRPIVERVGCHRTDHLLGKVWVEKGTVFCKSAPGLGPVVVPKPGIPMYLNGRLAERAVVIREEDTLTIRCPDVTVAKTGC